VANITASKGVNVATSTRPAGDAFRRVMSEQALQEPHTDSWRMVADMTRVARDIQERAAFLETLIHGTVGGALIHGIVQSLTVLVDAGEAHTDVPDLTRK